MEQSAPIEIDAFIDRLQAEMQRLRHESPTSIETRSKNFRDFGERIVQSNIAKIRNRMAAVKTAIESVRDLKFGDYDLTTWYDETWNNLPSTEL